MDATLTNDMIPGSILKKKDMGGVTGKVFLNKVFFLADGIMLSRVRDITGLDSSTLQNWVKRGWICKPTNKHYSKDQLARILIINMLRRNTPLERIDYLLRYINGNPEKKEDDIISESELYDYAARIIDSLADRRDAVGIAVNSLRREIEDCVKDYDEPVTGAAKRLKKALEIIVLSYYSVLITLYTEELFGKL